MMSPEELARWIFSMPKDFSEGKKFSYGNSGVSLMGRLIEAFEKMHLSDAFQKRICAPLRLKNTFLPVQGSRQNPGAKLENYAYGFGVDDYFDPQGKHILKPSSDWTFSVAYASWGLISTVADLGKFMRALVQEKICKEVTLKKMFTPLLQNYGWGINILTQNNATVFYHNGGFDGVSSTLRYYPEREMTLVILSSTRVTQFAAKGWESKRKT
ncbi:Beta-lactamase family protein [Candidatus Bealeia paramacronuclearis]|uniref:Beta-lactamase family protein n=1 Tax=Candidatus Bealeia paramacronuclearis TaxID=1921001 RepID=A0ABZ2C6X2_9PROT|nr:Beta-lactamase family protein [Candidatus Bealeia paramacronuclearis]